MSDVLENNNPVIANNQDQSARTFQMVLVKTDHRFCFRYQVGCEQQMIDAISLMANDPTNDLSAEDAWVLAHQVRRNAAGITQSQETPRDHDTQK